MAKALHRIDPRHLQPGMFIEELDRPWLETPLKFQSFCVRSLREVKWIKDNCEYVLVDPGKSDASLVFNFPEQGRRSEDDSALLRECLEQMMLPGQTPPPVIYARQTVSTPAERKARAFSLYPPKRSWIPWRRAVPEVSTLRILEKPDERAQLQQQIGRAKYTWQEAHKILTGVMTELRAGGELDVSAVERVVFPIIDCVLQSTDAMAFVLRMKETDDYLYNHALAASIWAVVFGKSLGFDRRNLEILGMGGLLLDIGKTRVPRELLLKSTPLDEAETALVRSHVQKSIEILDETGNINPKVYDMVRTHHERHDGSGYPERLQGNAIPLFGRIAGLVDTYDAMTSQRPNGQALSTYFVMQTLIDSSGKLFQDELIERFIRVVGIFPTASLVELNTGEIGIVVEQNALRRLRPKVMLILDKGKQMRSEFSVVDLGEAPSNTGEPGALWIVQGLQPGSWGIDPREYYL